MKKLLLLLSVLLAVLPGARADQKSEDAAIRQRHDEWSAAWNKHDPKLMASFFLPDGDLINPFGKHARGRGAIEQLFTQEQSGPMAGTTYSGTIESIRYMSKNIAIIDVAGEIAGMKSPDGSAAPPFKHHVTWIAEKKGAKWMAFGARAFASIPPPSGEK
ncbi:MAG: SgcJ/EcaC family oxidoreductase [Limisphaerales bacterium]